jgi:hypothetical protein
MADVKPGDEVRVFDVNGARVGQPVGGWTGEVVKVSPKLVHITYGGWYGDRPKAFRRDTGRANDAYEHQCFMTLDEVAEAERGAAARTVLREHKITLEHGNRLTVAQLEALAEVAKTFTQEG